MSTKYRVLLVVNPISGGKDKKHITDHIFKILKSRDLEGFIYRTTGKNDKKELTAIIKDYRPERIVSVGGDGTLKLLSEILQDDRIPLALIPAGSANGLAENLNLPASLKELTEVALGNHFVTLDSILINNELCLHISDIGLNAELIRNYEEGNVRGKLGYLIQSIPTIIRSNFPFRFSIETADEVLEKEAVLLGIANARKYGTGSTINPQGKYDDGKFEILIFKQFNIPEILKTFMDDVKPDKDFLEIISTTEARIISQKKVPFQIDGEYRGEVLEVHAKIAPTKVKIAAPQVKISAKG